MKAEPSLSEQAVLIIAYEYPPMKSGGVQRPLKFAKYLPEHGYQPRIVTVKWDSQTEHDVSGCVLRYEDIAYEDGLGTNKRPEHLRIFFYRLLRSAGYRLGVVSWRCLWYRNVLKDIGHVIARHKIKIVLATYPPIENLMIGVRIARKYGIPLVSDFRDGMTFEAFKRWPAFVWQTMKKQERATVKHSSAIIGATEPITDYFRKKFPGISAYTITNGFDADDWRGIRSRHLGDDKIHIVYTGSFSRPQLSVKPLINAIDELNAHERRRLRIYMIGTFKEDELSRFLDGAHRDVFQHIDFLPREEALAYQASADVLLLIAGSMQKSVATGKLFEYLGADKPILALTKGTVAEEIIGSTRTGLCADPNNREEIVEALRTIVHSKTFSEFYNPDRSEIEKFSRQRLTKELADILTTVINSKAQPL